MDAVLKYGDNNRKLGEYLPSFFLMRLYTKRNLYGVRVEDYDAEEFSTFFHEYIHFLQDISTFVGLNAMFVTSEEITSVAKELYEGDNTEFEVPYIYMMDDGITSLNRKVLDITYGYSSSVKNLKVEDVVLDSECTFNTTVKYEKLQDIVTVVVKLSNGDSVQLGRHAVLESMAYLLQSLCAPTEREYSDYPYRFVEKVAEWMRPGQFTNDPLSLIALCDASLMMANPGHFIYQMLDGIRNFKIRITKPEDFYEYVFSKCILHDAVGNRVDTLSYVLNQQELVRQQIKSYSRMTKEMTEQYERWVDTIFDFARDWRVCRPNLLLDMVRTCNEEGVRHNPIFMSIVHKLGSPYILDYICYEDEKTKEPKAKLVSSFSIPQKDVDPNIIVNIYAGIRALREIFKGNFSTDDIEHDGFCHCVNKEFCLLSKELGLIRDLDARCDTAPWERWQDKEMCPLAIVWRGFRLGRYTPVLRK